MPSKPTSRRGGGGGGDAGPSFSEDGRGETGVEQDQELLHRCLAGEDYAWETLLRNYTRKIYNLCYRFTGRVEEAEDVTQEVFIKVFQTLKSYDAAQGSFSTWPVGSICALGFSSACGNSSSSDEVTRSFRVRR